MISPFLIVASSIDGCIGLSDAHLSLQWTSKEDKKRFVELTKRARVMVMGRKTFATIGKGLPGRKIVVYSRTEPSTAIEGVEFTSEVPSALLARLESEGFTEVAVCGGSEIYSLFMENWVIDRIYFTVEPVIFGQGVRLFLWSFQQQFTLESVSRTESGTVFLDYKRK